MHHQFAIFIWKITNGEGYHGNAFHVLPNEIRVCGLVPTNYIFFICELLLRDDAVPTQSSHLFN